jgi:homoserine dehydrogenase
MSVSERPSGWPIGDPAACPERGIDRRSAAASASEEAAVSASGAAGAEVGVAAASADGRVAGAGVRVGLLGHGTVGSAFAELLAERADAVARITGRRPALSGTLTTSEGDFEQILASSDVIVELIGGLEPARDYLLAALRAGRHVVTANKQLLSHHGEELFEAAREGGAQLRFEAAVAGVVPVVRVLSESLAGAHVERVHGIVNGTTNFILTEMAGGSSYEQALAEAQRQGYAEADPSEDVSGKDAAAKMAILARLAFGTPVHIDQVPYEGIEHLQTDDLQFARELGLGVKLIGTAERRDGGLSVRVHPAFLYGGHPLASVSGPYNAVTVESEAITEITMSGPGAGGPQTASAVLGDLISTMLPPPALSPPLDPLPLVQDVPSAFYIHIELADRPGALASVAQALGEQGASIKSVVQRGLGESARLVMVIHPLAESSVREALERIGQFDFVRATPRAIRVIEEQFM